MAERHKYRDLIKILQEYDPRFEVSNSRGKGSDRMIFHPDVGGQKRSYPIKCHGEGCELGKGAISALVRRFELPKDLL